MGLCSFNGTAVQVLIEATEQDALLRWLREYAHEHFDTLADEQRPDLTAAAQDLCQKHGFEYHGPLGKGAFKSAYLAKAQTVFFALKIAVAAGGAERLARETKALQGCAHPAIAPVLRCSSV